MQSGNDHEEKRQAESGQRDDKRNLENDSRGLGPSARTSKETGFNQVGASGADCQGGDVRASINRGTIAGGILRQLTNETRDQLAYYKSQIQKLETRLVELDQLSEELRAKTEEDLVEVETPNEEDQEDDSVESLVEEELEEDDE